MQNSLIKKTVDKRISSWWTFCRVFLYGGDGGPMSPTNDDHILECALLFDRTLVDGGRVALLTRDTALKIKAMAEVRIFFYLLGLLPPPQAPSFTLTTACHFYHRVLHTKGVVVHIFFCWIELWFFCFLLAPIAGSNCGQRNRVLWELAESILWPFPMGWKHSPWPKCCYKPLWKTQ
jgi:hypothetical protein